VLVDAERMVVHAAQQHHAVNMFNVAQVIEKNPSKTKFARQMFKKENKSETRISH